MTTINFPVLNRASSIGTSIKHFLKANPLLGIAISTIGLVAATNALVQYRRSLIPHIIHICPIPIYTLDSESKSFEYTVQSFLTAMTEMQKYPNCPVIAAPLGTADIEPQFLRLSQRAKELFPTGIPQVIQELTYEQKIFIYTYGPAQVLALLQKIPAIYPPIRPKAQESLQRAVKSDASSTSLQLKEAEIVECAKEVLKKRHLTKQKNPTVIVLTSAFFDLKDPTSKSNMHYERVQAWRPQDISSASNEAADKKPRFIHVKQMHAVLEGFQTGDFNEAIVRSQLKVIEILRKHRECPILNENAPRTIQYEENGYAKYAQSVFPQGIPSNYEDLTVAQKQFLNDNGATYTMLYLKEITTVHKTLQNPALVKASMSSQRQIAAEPDEERERQTIALAREILGSAACSHQSRPAVVVVYGAAHDFTQLCHKNDLSHTAINTFPQ